MKNINSFELIRIMEMQKTDIFRSCVHSASYSGMRAYVALDIVWFVHSARMSDIIVNFFVH